MGSKSIRKRFSACILIFLFLLTTIFTGRIFEQKVEAAALLSENFEPYTSFPSGGWTNAVDTASWTIASDGSKVARNNTSTTGTYVLTNGTSTWANYSVSAKVKPGATGTRHGLAFRYKDAGNYYFFIFKDGSKVYLYKKVNGTETAITYASFTYSTSNFYDMKVTVSGSSITGYINGTQVLTGTDSSLTAGKVGLYTFGNASFDDVAVDDGTSLTPTPTATPTPTPIPTVTPTPTPAGTGTTYNITTASQFASVFASAQAGDTLLVSCNLGAISLKSKVASASNPITIKAATRLGYTMDSIAIDNCSGIVLEGFKIGPNSASVYCKIINSKDCKITRNFFDSTGISGGQSSILTTQATQNVEISYNLFDGKTGQAGTTNSGSYIKTQFDGAGLIAKNLWIHHNSFKNVPPVPSGSSFVGDSDRETICLGVAASQDELTNHIIEYNYFEDCDGENEIITVKTSQNIIRYNTFKNCLGSISIRFGTRTEVYGNYFFADSSNKNAYTGDVGGVRAYGSYHKIYNNYFQNLTGTSYRVPILLDGGDTSDSTGGDGHERASYCEVTNNTIVNCANGIGFGINYSLAPTNCKVSNNIIQNSQGALFTVTKQSGCTFEGNILNPLGSAAVGSTFTQDQAWVTDPLLTSAAANGYSIYKLGTGSPAIDYAKGAYSYVTTDMEGQARSTADTGADEYSAAAVTKVPLTDANVGPAAN